MKDTISGAMPKEEGEEAARKWQEEQDKFPGPIPEAPPPELKPPLEHSDFYERQQERARRREDYMRSGSG